MRPPPALAAMSKLAWIALAGAAGTLARVGVAGLVQRGRPGFPWGTLAVNLLGCLLFGFVWTVAADRLGAGAIVRAAVLFGFLGAFTTFSTFGFETAELAYRSRWALAAASVAANNLGGVACVFLGAALGRSV